MYVLKCQMRTCRTYIHNNMHCTAQSAYDKQNKALSEKRGFPKKGALSEKGVSSKKGHCRKKGVSPKKGHCQKKGVSPKEGMDER